MGITVVDVTKKFGGFVALENVSVAIPEGSLTALLGPSGSGKSTLLRVIAGLEDPDAGQVLLRSEEHTSELQSPCNLVCRLLLEKKILDIRPPPEQPDRSEELGRVGRLNRQQKRRQIQNTVPYRAHQGHTVWDLAAGAEHQHSLTTVHPHLPDHAANEPPTGIVVVNRPAQLRYSIARGPE